ncbi:Mbeg1-like protein [Marilutibacter chinensis]|uniref:Mbeg1-like protein n=1 Tax=Marilutibacter chinensis TaxID=2912247 RepID=UPI003CCE2397
MENLSNTPGHGEGFAGQIAGREPHEIDRQLSAILQDNYNWTDERRGREFEHSSPPAGWSRMDDAALREAGIDPSLLHDGKSGFGANFYTNDQGHVVLAFTGTDEGRDWRHNLRQGLGLRDAQYDQAIALAGQAERAYGDNLVITGHSLGGGLAAAASMVHEVPAVTFNAAGVNDRTLERFGYDADVLKQEAEQGLIRSYSVKSEILTHLQEDSFPLKYAMPDAPGTRIELPDPDPLSFFERIVPGKMLMHRVDLHYIDSVMEAQDAAGLSVRRFDHEQGRVDLGQDASARLDRLLAGQIDPGAQQTWDRETAAHRLDPAQAQDPVAQQQTAEQAGIGR